MAPAGDLVLTADVLGEPLILTASQRTSGALSSLRWRGREFLNAFDHGRELQSALSFDGWGECYNPTEAGSRNDGTGSVSTSRLIRSRVSGNTLETETDMAFWLAPGQAYPRGCGSRKSLMVAQNQSERDGYILHKRITVGADGVRNAILYDAEFTISHAHESATYELATAYMQPEFDLFLTYDPATDRIEPLSAGPGEQGLPVILSTPDRRFAMGVWSPDPAARYGRFQFLGNPQLSGWNTVKWNCVFRAKNVMPGVYRNRCYAVVGNVDEVARGIATLAHSHRK